MNFKPVKTFLFHITIVACVLAAVFMVLSGCFPAPDPTSGPDQNSFPLYISKAEPSADDQVIIHPRNPAPGDFLVVEASPLPGSSEVEIDFDFPGVISDFYRVGNLLYAVIGVCYDSEPGSFEITIRAENPGTINKTLKATVVLSEKEFQTAYFSMPARVTAGWTAERLAEDREKVKEARATSEPYPLWLNRFVLPLEGRVTSEYGAIRYINNNPPRRHAGLDIAEETGTPVVATNQGVVRLAEHLLSGGKTVIIDHGIGLSSTYMHLDSITVDEGQTVARGEQIGTLGMTGYATGPHLHWEVNLGSGPINPEQLLDNDLLWIPPAYVEKKISRGN